MGNLVVSMGLRALSEPSFQSDYQFTQFVHGSHYTLLQAAVTANAYDQFTPRDPVNLWSGDIDQIVVGFPVSIDGTWDFSRVQIDSDPNNDLWVNYLQRVTPLLTMVNTYSPADDVLSSWVFQESGKPTNIDTDDYLSDPPWSREWAKLSYVFPCRARAAGHVPIYSLLRNNRNVFANVIDEHSAIKNCDLPHVWSFFRQLVEENYVVGR